MKITLSTITLLSLLFSAAAKPGGSYVLTGREKSIFSIFQADMKAHWKLYEGEDVNECYEKFKVLNNLDGRKLKRGEELMFPHTKKSKKLHEDEMGKSGRAGEPSRTATATIPGTSEGYSSLFGSDRPSSSTVTYVTTEKKPTEEQRNKAVYNFQNTIFPHWVCNQEGEIVEKKVMDSLVALAREKVDEPFAGALILHPYADKNIYILEFEIPKNVGEYFFFAEKKEASGASSFYSLEKGPCFFGVGDGSVLREWRSGVKFADFGGRKYKDLSSFLKELEDGPVSPYD